MEMEGGKKKKRKERIMDKAAICTKYSTQLAFMREVSLLTWTNCPAAPLNHYVSIQLLSSVVTLIMVQLCQVMLSWRGSITFGSRHH